MARDGNGSRRSQPKFGRIDPFCWIAVVPMLVVAVGIAILGGAVLAVVIGGIAVLLVVFDSYTNRGAIPAAARREPDRRPAPSRAYRDSRVGSRARR